MGLNKIWKIIIKQYNFGPFLGGLKDMATYTAFYVTILNFTLIAVTAYNTTLREYILSKVPWFSFPLFMAALIVLVLIGMVCEFKFIYPSIWVFRNRQEYTHQSLLRKDLKKILDRLDELEEEIKKK